jgi:hypothetical protein
VSAAQGDGPTRASRQHRGRTNGRLGASPGDDADGTACGCAQGGGTGGAADQKQGSDWDCAAGCSSPFYAPSASIKVMQIGCAQRFCSPAVEQRSAVHPLSLPFTNGSLAPVLPSPQCPSAKTSPTL